MYQLNFVFVKCIAKNLNLYNFKGDFFFKAYFFNFQVMYKSLF